MGSSASVPITEEKKHKIREHFKQEVYGYNFAEKVEK